MAAKDVCVQCEDIKATLFCEQCQITLCEKCSKSHLKIPLCKDHVTVALEKSPICKVHDKLLGHNCVTCQVLLCDDCKLSHPTGHKVEGINKAFDSLLLEFKEQDDTVGGNLWILEEELKKVTMCMNKTEEIYNGVKKVVSSRAADIVEAVMKEKCELVEHLDQAAVTEINKLHNLKQHIESDINECRSIKTVFDSKKAALINSVGTNLKLEGSTKPLKSLNVCRVKINYPKISAHYMQPADMPVNRIGKIEYEEVVVGLRPKKLVYNGIGIPDAVHSKVEFDFEVIISSGASFRFDIVNDELWVPVHVEDIILIYSDDGKKKQQLCVRDKKDVIWGLKSNRPWENGTKAKYSIRGPRAVRQVTDNSVVVASETGLDVLGLDGNVLVHVEDGEFCDVYYNDVTSRFCALDFMRKCCVVYKATGSANAWIKEHEFLVRNCKVDHYGSVLLGPDCIIVCPGGQNHVIQKYTLDGRTVCEYGTYGRSEPGQLWGPTLCSIDHHGNLLIADVNNKRLQVLDKNHKWTVIYMDGLACPFDVKLTNQGLWALSQHSVARYKLMRYNFVK